MYSSVVLAAVFTFLNIHLTQSRLSLESESKIVNKIFDGYDRKIRPDGGENGTGPLIVTVNTYVRSVTNMDDDQMAYDVQLTFRQAWRDERLKYDGQGQEYITLNTPELFWIPDIFFSNEINGQFHNMITPNVLLRLYPDGNILYSSRISLRLACAMHLKYFPMDSQTCKIIAASYGYTTDDLVFVWKKNDPVQVTKTISSDRFHLNWFTTDYCTSRTNTGEYSCLLVKMNFSRLVFSYLEKAYIPTAAFVFLSWVVFWLHPKNSGIRFGIWMSSLVSIMIVVTSINDKSPEAPYTKALDVWTGVCLTFIFSVLLELCLVSNAVTTDERCGRMNFAESLTDKNSAAVEDHGKRALLRSYSTIPLKWLNKYSTKAQRIDAVSRFLFPVTFAFFNFIYWIAYASRVMDPVS